MVALKRLEIVALAVLFAVAHTQSPLYYSNQNQYLLHGASLAGNGLLSQDWLSTTQDPTPIFSLLTSLGLRFQPLFLQAWFFVLLMIYFVALRQFALAVSPTLQSNSTQRFMWSSVFILLHAAFLRWLSVRYLGNDYPWYFQSGLAAQYVLGPGIQPSVMGVFLILAIVWTAQKKSPVFVTTMAALPCLFHSTYLLPSGMFVLGYLIALRWKEKASSSSVASWQTILIAAMASLAVTLFPVSMAIRDFLFSGEGSGEALRILAEVRIPHHCLVSRWFDWIAGLQLAWIALGIFCCKKYPLLFWSLIFTAIFAVLFTLIQIFTSSHFLALLFPWRISVVLMPIATAAILCRAFQAFSFVHNNRYLIIMSLIVIIASAVTGGIVTYFGMGYRMADEEEAVYDYVRTHVQSGDVYFIPAKFPLVRTGRGAVSNTFAPPPRLQSNTNQIPVDLQRFRLKTGVPIFVDFKSMPYATAEVHEWYRRMKLAEEFTKDPLTILKHTEKITHMVLPVSQKIADPAIQELYRDEFYVVYRINK